MGPQDGFIREREALIREILDNYHYNSAIAITGDRFFINHCSERLSRLYYRFGCLVYAYVPPGNEEDYLRKLKRVRNALRVEYVKLRIRRNLYE